VAASPVAIGLSLIFLTGTKFLAAHKAFEHRSVEDPSSPAPQIPDSATILVPVFLQHLIK
jgi:hypothetical protein